MKIGLPKQFFMLRLNCMRLPCICGSLILKAGCFSLEFICSRLPSQCSVIHSASVSLYKGKQSVGSLKGENHKYFKHCFTSIRKNTYVKISSSIFCDYQQIQNCMEIQLIVDHSKCFLWHLLVQYSSVNTNIIRLTQLIDAN